MNWPLPTNLKPSSDERVEYVEDVGGLYFRAIMLIRAGDTVPQHAHDYEHVTLVCSGLVRVWVEGAWREDAMAFKALVIEANKAHVFQALTSDARLVCIHQLNGAQYQPPGA